MGKILNTNDYGIGYDQGYQDGHNDGYQAGVDDTVKNYEARMAKLNAELHSMDARITVLQRKTNG